MKSLTPVMPRHRTDCGIVAIATIAGVSYEKALRTTLPKRKKYASYGVSNREMFLSLCKLECDYYYYKYEKSSTPLKDMKNHAILIIKVPFKGYASGWDWHAVVWDAKIKKVIDGWHPPASPRKYQKMIEYYIEIY